MELSPDIELKTFCNACEEITKAMAIMRTRIVHHNEFGLIQLVLDEQIHWKETTGLTNYLEADRKQPMEMGQPLIRYALVRDDADTKTWFVWTVHHALYDGWSIPLILKAVTQVYHGSTVESTSQFNTFIKYIKEQDKEEATDYWRKALEDCNATPFPVLPASVQRPVADTTLERQLSYSQGHTANVTASSVVRAAWALVAGRMTNSDDVVFGVTVSGRNAPVVGIHTMVAPTIATVPVRVNLARDQRISEYLEGIQRGTTEMIPFEQTGLQRIAKISPEAQQACMFQTLLIIQPPEIDSTQDLIREWQGGTPEQSFNAYALTLDVSLNTDNSTVSASFDSRVVQPWAVQSLLEQLDFVLCQLDSTNPEQALSEIKMVTEQDLDKMWKWNSVVPAPIERCVHETIEEHARTQPNSPAICAWDSELTYSELDQLASRLAHRLADLGIGVDAVVPLFFEKSMWTTVAALGVFKAGGSFVMLDTSLLEQRLHTIVQEVKAGVIISSPLNQLLSSQLAPEVVTISSEFFADLGTPTTRSLPTPDPSSDSYMVFTSGSTGTPKGAILTHTNVSSALHYQVELLGLTKGSRVFDFASYSFDVSINNLFSALVTGGCLCVPSDDDRKNNLLGSIRSLRANVIELTPSVAQLLSPEEMPELQSLVLGGEAVSLRDVERWWDNVRIINTYGPSECTATSTVNSTASSPEEATRLGSGAGLVTWVVDPRNHDNLLPLGCIGELVLEGPLVGRGYLNNMEKTAEVFIQDPAWLLQGASGRPGRHGRLYKTGDLVRYNEDGSLTFVSRKDTQVKIRGQRIVAWRSRAPRTGMFPRSKASRGRGYCAARGEVKPSTGSIPPDGCWRD